MSYNRLDFAGHRPGDEEYHSPPMDPRHGRTPSPGHPLQGYQLQDPAVRRQSRPGLAQPLDIPMGPGDRLAAQPTYSVENIHGSYDPNHPVRPTYGYDNDYPISPEEHHDAYYNTPYNPNPHDDQIPLTQYQTHGSHYSDDDNRPILQGDPYGPDPHTEPEEYFDETPKPMASPAPIRRWKTVKEVQLFHGNLVLDCPIPPKLLNLVPHIQKPERDEFTHMRYSAATCDPREFYDERFTLRQKLFAKPRHTELFIVVTMYNEDDVLFARTMSGVFKNIEYMCSRTNSKTWGKEAWKKIVVCIVSDGRGKINPRTRAVLAGMGVYQDGIAKQQVNGKDVTAHIYEYTTQVGIE